MAETKTRLVVSAGTNALSLGVNLVISFFLTPFLIASLHPQRYGVWAVILAVVGYAGILDLGIGPAVTRLVAERLGRKDISGVQKAVRASLSLLLVMACLIVVLGLAFGDKLMGPLKVPGEMSGEFAALIRITSVAAAFTLIGQLYAAVLRAHEKFPLLNAIAACLALVRGGGMWWVLSSGGGLVELGYVLVVTAMANMAANAMAARLSCPGTCFSPLGSDRATYIALLSFGIAITIIVVANVFRFQMGSIIVAMFSSYDNVALFNIAATIAGYYLTLVAVPTGVLLPRFSYQAGTGDLENVRSRFIVVAKANAVFALALGLVIIVCSKGFLHLWLGKTLEASAIDLCRDALVVIVAGYLVCLSQASSVNLIYGMKRQRFLMVFTVAEGAAILLLSVVLVKLYGLIGVAIGIAVPMATLHGLILPGYTASLLHVKKWPFYWRCLLLPWIICGMMLVISCFEHWPIIKTWWQLVVQAAAYGLSFIGLALVVVFDRNERRQLFLALRPGL